MIQHPTVLHSLPCWLPQTQTWMYNQVNQLHFIDAGVHIACERTENLDQFPVANLLSFDDKPLFRQVWEKRLRRLKIRHHLFLQPSVTANDGDTEGGATLAIIE